MRKWRDATAPECDAEVGSGSSSSPIDEKSYVAEAFLSTAPDSTNAGKSFWSKDSVECTKRCVTSAIEAGVTDHIRTIEELVSLLNRSAKIAA
jgi:hypothetical protein